MIKNRYAIQGNTVLVYCDNVKDKDVITKVSLNTFNSKMKNFDVKWFAKWNTHTSSYYIQCTKYRGYHINHDTVDNTDENLRKISDAQNCKNRVSKNSNNKSGYRNVAVINGKFVVQLMVDGKNTKLGTFTDADEAGAFAKKMRQKYYGEFAGEN